MCHSLVADQVHLAKKRMMTMVKTNSDEATIPGVANNDPENAVSGTQWRNGCKPNGGMDAKDER